MRKTKEVTRTYTEVIETEITCDLCGKKAKNGDWNSSTYDVKEAEVSVTVNYKDGRECLDGGSGKVIMFDICPDCFKDVLVPFLQDKGAKVDFEDWCW